MNEDEDYEDFAGKPWIGRSISRDKYMKSKY